MSLRHNSEQVSDAPLVPVGAHQQKGVGDTNPPPRSRSIVPFVLIGLFVVGAIAFVAWPRGAPPPEPQPTAQVAVLATSLPTLEVPTRVPTPEPTPCPSIEQSVDTIIALQGKGDWKGATRTAEDGLARSNLCADDRTTLTRYAITSGLKALILEPSDPLNKERQQWMVDTYLALKKRASDAAITIDTPLQVATEAHSSSHFHLARVALEEDFKERMWDPEINRDTTKLYVSTLFGLGKHYTTVETTDPLYEEGLRWLVTSQKVAEEYHTGKSEAAMLLAQLGLPDPATWPPPAETPLVP